ncbi:PR domain zinc finger protein 2 [Salminus brasiliensis]|uniref:PR domain zinc finger protein 2 n=1 Tax=Salminus brasiliensis TaxID=930266 RepID=UPI003B82E3DE
MWDPKNAVNAEELSSSAKQQQQPIILQSPTENQMPSLNRDTPPSGQKRESETEGGTDEMMENTVDDQSTLQVQRTSCPSVETVSLLISDVTNQIASCETEDSGVHKQDCGSVLPLYEADADPDYDADGDLQRLCTFSCKHCQKRFTTRQGLERHSHASTSCNTQTFRCRHCRKSFSTQFGRRRHERRHDNSNRRTGSLRVNPSSSGEGHTQGIKSSQESNQSVRTSQTTTQSPVPDSEGRGDSDGSGETKTLFACKYCKKAFGTHTNLRRHERRIHERHLLPRGVRQKVTSSQERQGSQQPGGQSEASSAASKQRGEGGEQQEEEFMVDISSNISENLSFYIDGKIISTSAVTNCEVMEVNSAAAAVIGLDALIISPAQITQALKIETNDCSMTSDLCGQPSGKRRTSTPPLLPQIKTELESESILTTSSSGPTVIGTVLPQPLETIVLQKEKTIYLSPKLKQLLQNQDSSKSFALIGDGQKLCPPLPLTLLPAGTSRFKRRTTSPPSSSQQSSASGVKTTPTQESVSPPPKVQKTESHCTSPAINSSKKDETATLNPDTNDATVIQQVLPLDCSTSGTGGRSCNQQPLDLSNAMGKRNSEVLAECVLDLSTSRKSTESDSTESSASQTPVKRIKPNSSMLEKVLLNQYAGVDVPAPADAGTLNAPVVTDLAVMAVSEPISANPERVVFELSLPSSSAMNTSPHPLNPAVLQTTPAAQLLSAPASSTAVPTEVLPSVPISIPNQELFSLCSTAQSFIPIVPTTTVEVPVENSLPAFNVSLPDWLNSASGSVTHALIPTTPPLSLQSPQFLTDPSVCDLAQRTLVVDSVLSPDAQIFSPSLSVNQSNFTSLSFPPNVVVIEYTVALESSDAAPVLQANAVHSLSDHTPPDHTKPEELHASPQPQAATNAPSAPELQQAGTLDPVAQDMALHSSTTAVLLGNPATTVELSSSPSVPGIVETQVEPADTSPCLVNLTTETPDTSAEENPVSEEPSNLLPLCKRFMCNACDEPFQSMKGLSRHIGEHSDTWPYKCEFCVQLFESETGLLEHRSSYHGIGKIYVCRICSKEFAFLCNLEQHHRDVHPGQECSHTEVENGKLRPENHNSPVKTETGTPVYPTKDKIHQLLKPAVKEEYDNDSDNTTEELYTTIKIMASEGVKPKGTDVRLGINQHYPSFKPPPFPYHNRTPATTTTATATNFTTHNIPQTFSTAIRCTKCGKSFDNMPELHKHILACANASDKKRYTPKKNPIPLKQFAKAQNGVLSPARGVNSRQNVSQKIGQPKKLSCQEPAAKVRLNVHGKKKSVWVQRGRQVGRKGSQEDQEVYVCPHCSKEFTYHASLKKHMVVSCPMKPVCNKKSKKRKGSVAPAQENNGSIRTRVAAEIILKQRRSNHGQKIFKKPQINESGSANNATLALKAHDGKRKILVHNFRPKRSDVLSTSAVHLSKKSKHVLMEGIQSPQTLHKSPTMHGKSQQPSHRVQGMVREMKQREMDVKLQPRTEERFSQRGKERTERPITRSLQQVNATVNTVANATNKKANTITLAKHPVQTDSQTVTAIPEVIESKK